jgi:hypothetical protein
METLDTIEIKTPTIAELEDLFRDKTQSTPRVGRFAWTWAYLAGLRARKWTGRVQFTFTFNRGGVNDLRVYILQEVTPD